MDPGFEEVSIGKDLADEDQPEEGPHVDAGREVGHIFLRCGRYREEAEQVSWEVENEPNFFWEASSLFKRNPLVEFVQF